MKKLNICVDIDGTITEPFYWLKLANYHFNKHVREEEIKEYEIDKVLGISVEDYNKFYEKYFETLHLNSKPRIGASVVLNGISKLHNIYYVSAREQRLKGITLDWLKKYNMPLKEIYLLGSHYKVQKAKELNCDLFIEDRYENAVELANAGIDVILIDCSYNRKPLVKGIIRVFNWEQIWEIIISLEKQKEIA